MKLLRFIPLLLLAVIVVTSCQKELGYDEGNAAGTLQEDGTGECLPILINGTYKKDTLLRSSNYVDIQVNLTSTGAYTILTDTVNGYSFSATGQAAVTGLQMIRLQASGRPIAPSIDVFTVKFSGTDCQFNVIVTGTGGGGPTPSTDSIVANIDGIYKTFKIRDTAKYDDASVPGYHLLNVFGESNNAGDEAFTLGVGLPTGTPLIPGTYSVTQFPASFVGAAYQNVVTGGTYFVASGFGTPPSPPFTINITSLTSSKVVGTFSGAISDAFGVDPDIQVTNGKFSVTIYP